MKTLPPNTFTKAQALLVVGKVEARKKIEKSKKEIWTVDEINELRGFKLNGTDTFAGFKAYHSPYRASHNQMAEDDLVHSYDNNFGEWR